MSEPSYLYGQSVSKKIRSKHRRRLLSRLTEGEATVSELSSESKLRMPHVSAEIKRMREDGLATSDLPPGSRGARIRLTGRGWEVLESDDWSKVLGIQQLPLDRESCCVLSRDEENLTLCFLSPPTETMVQIPNRIQKPLSENESSTRNPGVSWNWAVLSERLPRWFDRISMEVLDSPPEIAQPGSIEAYGDKPPIFGLVRAKLLNSKSNPIISPGEWFIQPDQIQRAPLDEPTYHRGEWILGSPHSKSPDIRPIQPIAAILKERLPRSVLLRSARANSLVIADLSGLDMEGHEYPIDALDYWIEIAHPRLSEAERKRRLNSLRDRILSSRSVKVPESTLRKFRKEWGGRKFAIDASIIRAIDLRGLGKTVTESLIRWSIETKSTPLVIEIQHQLPNSLLSRIASNQELRLVIIDNMVNQFSSFDTLEVDRIRTLPWLSYSTSSGEIIPVRMVEQGKTTVFPEEVESTTISPWTILGITSGDGDFEHEIEPSSVTIVRSALSQYPHGDEEWANQMEARYPLAAWIASPKNTRWQRWQRVSTRIESEWMALLDLNHLPIERISELADQAPESVKKVFSETISSKLRDDPDNLLRSWPAIDPNQANSGAAWLASHFIQNSAWLPQEAYSNILGWAVEAWLSHPPRESIGALIGLKWLYRSENRSQDEIDRTLAKIREIGYGLSEGHHLNTWSRLQDYASGKIEANLADISLFLRDLPNSWWAPFSSDFLSIILDSPETDKFLEIDIPWCSTVLRPIDEPSDAPGLSSIRYSGCDPMLLISLQSYLRSFQGTNDSSVSLNHLWDLLHALESAHSGSTPKVGKSHQLSGWLAQPKERWPDFSMMMMMEGDINISESLILGKSGFHSGLLFNEESVQPLGS
jgi:DNA-binding transcriptional ArsR family regulator